MSDDKTSGNGTIDKDGRLHKGKGSPDGGQFAKQSDTTSGGTAEPTKKAYDSQDKFGNMIRNMPQGAKERVAEINSTTEKPKRPEVEEAYGFADKERQNTKNHVSHAKELGFKNQRDYERAAVDFFNSSRGKLYYSERRKRYYRYDERTGEMVVSSNGVIHTYLKRSKKDFQKIIGVDKLNG